MKKNFLGMTAAVAAWGFASALAANATVEQAKANCVVGEQADGYLGVIDPAKADAAVRREVAAINLQRKDAYSRFASSRGVTIEVAAALTAEKLIALAGPGQCVRDGTGTWVKKP